MSFFYRFMFATQVQRKGPRLKYGYRGNQYALRILSRRRFFEECEFPYTKKQNCRAFLKVLDEPTVCLLTAQRSTLGESY